MDMRQRRPMGKIVATGAIILIVALALLKLTGEIHWSWACVTAPLWIIATIAVAANLPRRKISGDDECP